MKSPLVDCSISEPLIGVERSLFTAALMRAMLAKDVTPEERADQAIRLYTTALETNRKIRACHQAACEAKEEMDKVISQCKHELSVHHYRSCAEDDEFNRCLACGKAF